jgi:hypothetical protein
VNDDPFREFEDAGENRPECPKESTITTHVTEARRQRAKPLIQRGNFGLALA